MIAIQDILGSSLRSLAPLTNEGQFDLRETWQTVRNMVKTVNNPADSDISHGINRLIADATERTRKNGGYDGATDPVLEEMYHERYDPPFEFTILAKMPVDSLGRKYYEFITKNQIDPLESLTNIKGSDLITYLYRRAYKLHDIMHIVMDCDATILGEVRIVSFSVGQSRDEYSRQAPMMALAVLYLHLAIKKPWQLPEAFRLSAAWRKKGEAAPTHVSFRFEDHWAKTPTEVREMYLSSMPPHPHLDTPAR